MKETSGTLSYEIDKFNKVTVWIGFREVKQGGRGLWGSLSNPTPKIARGTISGTLKDGVLGRTSPDKSFFIRGS